MSKKEDAKLMTELIFDKTGKLALTAEEVAPLVNRTVSALKADRTEADGIPFTRLNNKPNGKPLYSITAIANHLINNEVKTI